MPQVANTVRYSDKEIRDMLLEDAKRQVAQKNVGSSSIQIVAGVKGDPKGAPAQEIGSLDAVVSFAEVPIKK